MEEARKSWKELKARLDYQPSQENGFKKSKEIVPSYQSIFSAIEDYEDGPGPGNYMIPDGFRFQRLSNWRNSPKVVFPKAQLKNGSVLLNSSSLEFPTPWCYDPEVPKTNDHSTRWSSSPRFQKDALPTSPGPAAYDSESIFLATVPQSEGISIGRGPRFMRERAVGASGPGTYDVVNAFKGTSNAAKSRPANVKFGSGHEAPCPPLNHYFEENLLGKTSSLGPAVSGPGTTLSSVGGIIGTSPRTEGDGPFFRAGKHLHSQDNFFKKAEVKERRDFLDAQRQEVFKKKLLKTSQSLPSLGGLGGGNAVSFGSPSSTSRLNFRKLRQFT